MPLSLISHIQTARIKAFDFPFPAMTIITEVSDETPNKPRPRRKPQSQQQQQQPQRESSSASGAVPIRENPTTNPFAFWLYVVAAVSLVTLLFVSFSSLSSPDPKSWYLSLPGNLREHYSRGRTLKIQMARHGPDLPAVEVFAVEKGPALAEAVLFVHGYGASSYLFRDVVSDLGSRGVRAVAVDLPGNGFSDKAVVVEEDVIYGVLERFRDVYGEIKEKGLFYAFDRIVETGQMPYQEFETPLVVRRKRVSLIELGDEEVSRVLGQVIETMRLSPVHLVLHDSALSMCANWVSTNRGLVKSLILVDPSARPAFPLWPFGIPLVSDVILGLPFMYERLMKMFCVKGISSSDLEAHRILLKGRDGRRAVVAIGKNLNYSFDAAEWGASESLRGLPMQVLWSSGWSEEWKGEMQKLAKSLPQAKFVEHPGGRWPQVDSVAKLSEIIFLHVSSLPKSVRKVEDEPLPEHIQKMFDEAKGDHNSHHHDHHHHHDHEHMAGYMNAYGIGGHGHGHGHGW